MYSKSRGQAEVSLLLTVCDTPAGVRGQAFVHGQNRHAARHRLPPRLRARTFGRATCGEG